MECEMDGRFYEERAQIWFNEILDEVKSIIKDIILLTPSKR